MGHQERCLTEDSNLLESQIRLKEKDWMENATVEASCCEVGQGSPELSHHGVHRGPTAVGAENSQQMVIASLTALDVQACKSV